VQAEQAGLQYLALCPANTPFEVAFGACRECLVVYNVSGAALTDIAKYVEFCVTYTGPVTTLQTETGSPVSSSPPLTTPNATAVSISRSQLSSLSSEAAFWSSCAWDLSVHGTAAFSCTAVAEANGRASSTPASTSDSPHHRNIGAIVGGVVGGMVGLILLSTLVVLVTKRRQKQQVPPPSDPTHEKAQLHSDDVKPDRKELKGTDAPRALLQNKPTEISELPANEEVQDQGKVKEMPSNEIPAHEKETTENEMAALDRMARMTDSTTLGNSNSRSEEP
jgi:hypothetical protein